LTKNYEKNIGKNLELSEGKFGKETVIENENVLKYEIETLRSKINEQFYSDYINVPFAKMLSRAFDTLHNTNLTAIHKSKCS
jgi:hypothetical protein